MEKYIELFKENAHITVLCKNGTKITGFWVDWFDEGDFADGEGEFIIVDSNNGTPIEIYVNEIELIERNSID